MAFFAGNDIYYFIQLFQDTYAAGDQVCVEYRGGEPAEKKRRRGCAHKNPL